MSSYTTAGVAKVANEALIKIRPELNVINTFATSFNSSVADWGTAVKVPVINGGTLSAFDESTNDMEAETASLSWEQITLSAMPKGTYTCTSKDCIETEYSPFWREASDACGESLKKYISDYFGGMFLSSDPDLSANTYSLTSVTKSTIAKLRAQCTERVSDTVLLLGGQEYAELISLLDSGVYGNVDPFQNGKIDGLFGFKAVGQLIGAGTGVKGALVGPGAIGFASRTIQIPPEAYIESAQFTDDNGFTVQATLHFSQKKLKYFYNIFSLFGGKVLKPESVKLLI